MYYKEKIRQQEIKDAYITERVIADMLSGNDKITDLTFKQMPDYTNYDLVSSFSLNNRICHIAFEIKERNKTIEQLKLYATAEIKVKKLDLVMNATQQYNAVYFVLLLNDSMAYIFNLRKLDWSKCRQFTWTVKKTQYSDCNDVETVPTWGIPLELAEREVDITDYVYDFNQLQAR